MKKLSLILILLAFTKAGICQRLLLTGNIQGATQGDSVEVNIPYDGNYWKNNSTYLKTDTKGNFHTSFASPASKFILLFYKGQEHRLLLTPGRPLHLNIKAGNGQIAVSGKAKMENQLLQNLHLEDKSQLGFIKELKQKDNYTQWSVDSVSRIKLPQIKHSLDSTEQIVAAAQLPKSIKNILAAEVKYYYAEAVAHDIGGRLYSSHYKSFHTVFIDTALALFNLPDKNQLNVGVWANVYLDSYFRFKLWKAIFNYRADTDREHADQVFKNETGETFKNLANDPDRVNEVYSFATHLKLLLPQYAREKQLTNLMINFCMSGQLMSADKLLHFMRVNYPVSPYLQVCEKVFAPLKAQREQYAGNLNIKIRPDYRDINSLQALLAPYKGKVVLVDMWGTWCPHCVEDMAYEPDLKKSLKGQDVVYLYVATDEDKDDEKWRDFIFINNLTGEHVRRTAHQVASLWNQLGVIDAEQSYPRYFIFDKAGNRVVDNAHRPGDGDALYKQLKSAIDK